MATYNGTSATVWTSWVQYDSSSTTSSAYYDPTWTSWQTTSTTYYSANTTYVWRQWVQYEPTQVITYEVPEQPEQIPYIAPAPIDNSKWKELEKKKQEAEAKALDLLLDLIGEEQAKIFKETGNLLVKGEKFDWLLEKDGKVYRVEKDKVVQLCLHTTDRFKQPEADNVIALALHAKFAEKAMSRGHHINDLYNFQMPKAAVM